MEKISDATLTKVVAAVAGAVVSLRFVKGTLTERGLMTVGGAALSFFSTEYVVHRLYMYGSEGLVGFLIGLFGMALVAKAYEIVQSVDAAAAAGSVVERIRKMFG